MYAYFEHVTDFIILTTLLLCSFNQGDVHGSFVLCNREKLKIKIYRFFGKFP